LIYFFGGGDDATGSLNLRITVLVWQVSFFVPLFPSLLLCSLLLLPVWFPSYLFGAPTCFFRRRSVRYRLKVVWQVFWSSRFGAVMVGLGLVFFGGSSCSTQILPGLVCWLHGGSCLLDLFRLGYRCFFYFRFGLFVFVFVLLRVLWDWVVAINLAFFCGCSDSQTR